MLKIDQPQLIDGVSVFGDDKSFDTFYLLPEQPRFRRDENGDPVFKFLKYREPISHDDGSRGGGFAIFDIEFTVPEERLQTIKDTLQDQVDAEAERRRMEQPPDVKIGTINYTKGTANLNVFNENEVLVESVYGAGKPSLYGRNISTWSAEFTPEGATLFEAAMKDKGPVVNIVYDLWFTAKLPPMKVNARFNASAFYSFFQEIDIDKRLWREDDYRETMRERMVESESLNVNIDPGGITDQDLIQEVRSWALRSLEDAVERRMIEDITPVSEEDRDVPDGIENVTRDVKKSKISSFHLNYTESATVEYNKAPQGALTSLVGLKDGEGKAIKWEDYAATVSLDDPFFQTINVSAFVNADFEDLPLHSVELKLNYNGRPMDPGEERFTSPEDVGHFAAFVEDDNWNYEYSYQINYRGESEIFQSRTFTTNENLLTIGVGDTGILDVNVRPGDLDFEQVRQALVTMRYEDPGADVGPIEQQFTLSEPGDVHRFQHVIFEPVNRPYEYRVKYFMDNGKELESEWRRGRTSELYIDDAFSNTRTISIRAGGDLQNEIANIFLDLEYVDEENDYSQQESIALNRNNNFFDWSFPVIKEREGTVTYSGTIQYQNGTSEEIEETVLIGNTLLIPQVEEAIEIRVMGRLLDFEEEIDLAVVTLSYEDEENDVSETTDFVIEPENKNDMMTWKLELEDREKTEYEWEAEFFMKDGSSITDGPHRTDKRTVVLRIPATA